MGRGKKERSKQKNRAQNQPTISQETLQEATQQAASLVKGMAPEAGNIFDNIDQNELMKSVGNMVEGMMKGGNPFENLFSGMNQAMQSSNNNNSNNNNNNNNEQQEEPRESSIKHVDTSSSKEIKRTEDIHVNLDITLEDMFTGKVKKIYLKRKRFHSDSHGNKKIVKERKKLRIPIERGCREGAILRFAKEGDEKHGYETGDVCVHIHQIPHERFERSGDDLFYDMDISISEVYDLKHVFQTIDNRKFVIMSEPGDILYSNHALRKIPGLGMPTGIENGFGNLFIRFNVIFQEESLNSNEIKVLKGFFPPVCYNLTENEEMSELKLMQASEEEYEMYGSEEDDDGDYNTEDVSIPSSEENFDDNDNIESFSEEDPDENGDDEVEESQPQIEEIVEE